MIIDTCEDLYKNKGYSLNESVTFSYSYQCNIQCDHCCLNCGPHRTEKIDMEDAKYILKGIAASGKRCVDLMGGEPFLNYVTLSELILYSSDIGLDIDVSTNGFWSKTVETARHKLSDLSVYGLKRITVSIDTFHQKFIPLAYPLNVIRAARELGLSSFCVFCTSSDLKKDQNILSDLKKEGVDIFIINTTPAGRSASLMLVPDIRSCKLLNINILLNGDTFACCGHSDENKDIINTPLYMGNCIKEKPEAVLSRKNPYHIQSFFDPGSPIWFKNFLEQEPYKEIWENKKYRHICELCKEMLNVEDISRKVMAYDPFDKSERI